MKLSGKHICPDFPDACKLATRPTKGTFESLAVSKGYDERLTLVFPREGGIFPSSGEIVDAAVTEKAATAAAEGKVTLSESPSRWRICHQKALPDATVVLIPGTFLQIC